MKKGDEKFASRRGRLSGIFRAIRGQLLFRFLHLQKQEDERTKDAEEDEVAFDLARRVAFEDDAARVVFDGRVGREVVGVVAEKRVVAPRDGKRSLVLLQPRIRLGLRKQRQSLCAGPSGSARSSRGGQFSP